MSYIIQARKLNKSIGDKHIIKDLELQVKRGNIFVLIGPNGAGKSTTIKLLNGITKQDSGTIHLFNKDKVNEKSREKIGILSDTTLLYDHLTGVENVLFFAKLYGMKDDDYLRNRINDLFKLLNLDKDKDNKVATYSTGMKKRVLMIKAVIHHPDLLFLDEPTSGLDPESIEEVNRFILHLQEKEGMTIFLCSHHLDEAELLGDEFGFLANGKIFAQDNLEGLQKQLYKKVIFTINDIKNIKKLEKKGKILSETSIEFVYQDEEEIAFIIQDLVKCKVKIYNIDKIKITLKDVYFKLLEESKNELE